MIIKKTEAKNTVLVAAICLLGLIAATFAFKLYHDSKYEKAEYDINCNQNYGDPISLARCYWSYKFEGQTLNDALKIEIIGLIVVPILIYIVSMI